MPLVPYLRCFRLMNTASKTGAASVKNLQHLFTASDSYYDPQAFILAPENVILISKEIVKKVLKESIIKKK